MHNDDHSNNVTVTINAMNSNARITGYKDEKRYQPYGSLLFFFSFYNFPKKLLI